jgi:hypothetical protein
LPEPDSVIGDRGATPQNVARTIAIVFIFILLIDDCFTNILSVYGRTMPESLAF